MNNLLKKAVAECIGTFVLVFAACGAAAFLGDAVGAALAFGLVIVAMAYSIGRISGCHINPAVSLGCLIAKRMTLVEFFVYVAAQIVGGFLGAVALFGFAKLGGWDLSLNSLACNFTLNGALEAGPIFGALLVEVVLTCVFVYVILNVTAENSGAGKKAGIIIGLTLTLVHLVGIPFTGTSVNPARSLAPAILQGGKALIQVKVFVVAPFIGAALAALFYKLVLEEKEKVEPKKSTKKK